MCRAQWSGWLPSWGESGGFTSEHFAPSNNGGKDSQERAKGWDLFRGM